MRTTAALLALLFTTAAPAAVFHLDNVVLGTYASAGDPISHPYAAASGYFVFDGAFETGGMVTDYSVKFTALDGSDLGTVDPAHSHGAFDQIPEYRNSMTSDADMTFIRLNNKASDLGFSFSLPVGAGYEITATGSVPLYLRFEKVLYTLGTIGGYAYPMITGWLTVDNSETPAPYYSAPVNSVPEPSTWAAMIAGLLMIGWLKRPRRQ